MSPPLIKTYVSWSTTPSGTPSWVEVTDWTESVSYSRGRSSERGRFSPGKLTIVLKNTDRRFDPATTGYTGGPYGSNVRFAKRVKVEAHFPGPTVVPLIVAFIDSIDLDLSPNNAYASSVLTCSDGLKVIARGKTSGALSMPQEAVYDRIDRLLDIIGWPAGDRLNSTSLGEYTITQAYETDAPLDVLGHINRIVDDEDALYYVMADGRARYRNRRYQQNPYLILTPDITFDNTGATGHPFKDADFSSGDADFINQATITRQEGGSFTIDDATSQSNSWLQSFEDSALLAFDGDARGRAEYIVAKYKDPTLRIGTFEVSGYYNADPTVGWQPMLERELGDLARIKRTHPGGGSIIDFYGIIEQITFRWVTREAQLGLSYGLSPANTTLRWRLGDSTYGVLGSTANLGV